MEPSRDLGYSLQTYPLYVIIPPADELYKDHVINGRDDVENIRTMTKVFGVLNRACSLKKPEREFFETFPEQNRLRDWRDGLWDALRSQLLQLVLTPGQESPTHDEILMYIIHIFISEVPWNHIGQVHLLDCIIRWLRSDLISIESGLRFHSSFPNNTEQAGSRFDFEPGAQTWNGQGSRWVNRMSFVAKAYRKIKWEFADWANDSICLIQSAVLAQSNDDLPHYIRGAALWISQSWPELHSAIRQRHARIGIEPGLLDQVKYWIIIFSERKDFEVRMQDFESQWLLRHAIQVMQGVGNDKNTDS